MKCLCGKEATKVAYLPMRNIFARIKQVNEAHNVCDYHAQKAKDKGYLVEDKMRGGESYEGLY